MHRVFAGIGIAGVVVGGLALGAIGFGPIGIVGGSIAAGIQAGIGNVVARSPFAIMTSLGMTGVLSTTANVGAVLGAGGLAGALALVVNYYL